MRKKVDERIRTLIENGVKTRHRSMFVIIGDKSRDQALSTTTRYSVFFLILFTCLVFNPFFYLNRL